MLDAKMAVALGDSLSRFTHKRKWEGCDWQMRAAG